MARLPKKTSNLELRRVARRVEGVADSAITTHSGLSGLGADDHPHYLTEARADARYALIGSAGGPAYTPPPRTGWSWVNQGGASVVDTTAHQAITGGAAGSGANLRLRVRTLSPTSNYTLTTAVQLTVLRKTFLSGGLVLRNSTTGALVLFDIVAGSSELLLRASRFNNATSFSADYQVAGVPLGPVIWMRIQDNGTNRIFSWSVDGDLWVQFFSGGRTDFTTPDQIGFCSGVENTSLPNIAPSIKLLHWVVT